MNGVQRVSRRTFIGGTLGTGATVLLAACGTQPGAVPAQPDAKEGAPAPKAADTAAKQAAARAVVHSDWWVPGGAPTLQEYFDGIKEDFEGMMPGVTVEYVFVESTTGVQEKVTTMVAAGQEVSTSQVSVAFIRDWLEKGFLAPLDAYQSREPDMAPDKFVDAGKFYNQFEGQTYGIPYDGPASTVIAYNKKHLIDAGLDPDRSVTWNWDWDTFLEYATKLHQAEGENISRMGFDPGGFSLYGISYWLYPNGGQLYANDLKRVAFNSSGGVAAVQFNHDLWFKHRFGPAPEGFTLENDQISMDVYGTWSTGYITGENPDLDFDYAPYPKGPNGTAVGSTTWTNQWSMLGAAKDPDLAWEWLTFVNSESTLEQYFAGVLARAAGRKEFYQSEAWQARVAERPMLQDLEKIADTSGQYPWVRTKESNDATADIWTALQEQKITVPEALAEAEQKVNAVLSG